MRVITTSILVLLLCITAVSGQGGGDAKKKEQDAGNPPKPSPEDRSTQSPSTTPNSKSAEPLIMIYLVGGGQLQVEELRETNDGVWYKRGGVTALLDRKRVARIEQPSSTQTAPPAVASQDATKWTISDARRVENFFITKFGRPLPTTAFGQSDLHNRWGLDHRQGIDVGLHPDSREGLALVEFLRTERIPFLVFRNAIPGVATGPHIHIGNASHRFLPR